MNVQLTLEPIGDERASIRITIDGKEYALSDIEAAKKTYNGNWRDVLKPACWDRADAEDVLELFQGASVDITID